MTGKNGYPAKRLVLKIKKLRDKMGIASSSAKVGLAKYLQMLSSGLSWGARKEKTCGGNSLQLRSPHRVPIVWESQGTLGACVWSHAQSVVCR